MSDNCKCFNLIYIYYYLLLLLTKILYIIDNIVSSFVIACI